jgi:riboflavin kinase/FMN adenylyltransferase
LKKVNIGQSDTETLQYTVALHTLLEQEQTSRAVKQRMAHIHGLNSITLDRPALVTIGVFDGVHRGHQYLIKQLVQAAHATDRLAVVLTLFPHPDLVLSGVTGRYYLTTPDQKAALLGALGVDMVITQPFDDDTRHLQAANFVDKLLSQLHMAELWITTDFALGYKREGNFSFLQAQGSAKGFIVHEMALLDSGHASGKISSTAIRTALIDGQVDQAVAWLGRPYAISGFVVQGDQRGRTIGFPTANVDPWAEQVIPANGVYACYVILNGERFSAVTNVGQRPTFNGAGIRIESHLLDFNRDIYGEMLTVEFVARLRGEQKFSGIDALIAQIRTDAEQGRAILAATTAQSALQSQVGP